MRRVQLLTLLLVLMVITNGLSLWYILSNRAGVKPPPPAEQQNQRPDPGGIIVDILKFDEEQQGAYEDLKVDLFGRIAKIDDQRKALKDELFFQLSDEVAPNQRKSREVIIRDIGILEMRKDSLTIAHFESIRRICKPHQIPIYNQMMRDLGRTIRLKNAPIPPSRRMPRD